MKFKNEIFQFKDFKIINSVFLFLAHTINRKKHSR